MPVGSVLKVQHLEGGIVQDVLVEDGDMVTQGQILIHLDPSSFEAEKGQLATRRAFLEFQVERLRAFTAGEDIDLSKIAENSFATLEEDQQAILQAQIRSLSDRKAVLQTRLEQRKAEEAGLVLQLGATAREVEALSQERDVYTRLFKQGIGSKVSMLQPSGIWQVVNPKVPGCKLSLKVCAGVLRRSSANWLSWRVRTMRKPSVALGL